jgi:hypothetical protein
MSGLVSDVLRPLLDAFRGVCANQYDCSMQMRVPGSPAKISEPCYRHAWRLRRDCNPTVGQTLKMNSYPP